MERDRNKKIEQMAREHKLTAKEYKIFILLAEGANAKQISKSENITYATARWYISQIYQKLEVSKQTELMQQVYAAG